MTKRMLTRSGLFQIQWFAKQDSSKTSPNEIYGAIGYSGSSREHCLECRATRCKLSNNLPVLGNQILKIPNTHWELMFLLFAIGLAIVLCLSVLPPSAVYGHGGDRWNTCTILKLGIPVERAVVVKALAKCNQ
jgi:hypothetical protein